MEHDLKSSEELIARELKHEETIVREVAKKNDYFLGISILIAGVLIAGSVVYSVGKSDSGTAGNPPGGGDPVVKVTPSLSSDDVVLGDKNAPVTIYEFADYQCPFCGRFHSQTAPLIRENYVKTGKVKMVMRDFAFLGPESVAAASAAHCAKDQGKFWAYGDALYNAEIKDGREHNGNLNKDLFLKLAGDLGLNVREFRSCLDTNKYDALVNQLREDAARYGVNSTPSLFVNATQVVGAQPYSVFQAAIEAELKK